MVDDILGNYQHWFMDSLTHIPHFNVQYNYKYNKQYKELIINTRLRSKAKFDFQVRGVRGQKAEERKEQSESVNTLSDEDH